jgi:hypothetical protein
MNIFKIILFFFLILVFTKCDFTDNKLTLVNNSEQAIYYLAYPDTIVNIKSVENFSEIPYRKIKSGDSTHPIFARLNEGGYKNKVKKYGQEKKLHMFYFSVDSVNKYGWNNLLKSRIYKRNSFSISALDSLNWRIYFENFE